MTDSKDKDKKKDEKTTSIDDWMVRIAFAEAGEPDMGFKQTGIDLVRKTKLALDKIMVVRSERMATVDEQKRRAPMEKTATDKLHVMILDDEPIVGKRLKPTLERSGFAQNLPDISFRE